MPCQVLWYELRRAFAVFYLRLAPPPPPRMPADAAAAGGGARVAPNGVADADDNVASGNGGGGGGGGGRGDHTIKIKELAAVTTSADAGGDRGAGGDVGDSAAAWGVGLATLCDQSAVLRALRRQVKCNMYTCALHGTNGLLRFKSGGCSARCGAR